MTALRFQTGQETSDIPGLPSGELLGSERSLVLGNGMTLAVLEQEGSNFVQYISCKYKLKIPQNKEEQF